MSLARATSISSVPVSRSPPWWRCTRREGAKRSTSLAHWRVTLIGQTTSVGPNASHAVLLPLRGEHRDRLHGLAEPHVVGEDGADSEVAEEPQPAVAALLEREQRLRHRRRRAERREAPVVVPGDQARERLVERHLAELETGVLELDSRDGADEIDHRSLAAPVEEEQGLLDLGAPQCVPAAADPDQRLLGGRELDQLFLGQRRVADRELPVEAGEGVGREQAARVRRDARRGEVDAEAARGGDPVPRQQHRHADLLQARDRRAEKEADVVVAELDPGGLDGSNAIPPSARTGSIRPSCRCTAIRGSDERRKLKTASPPSWSREVGRASVGSSAAWSHSSSTTAD